MPALPKGHPGVGREGRTGHKQDGAGYKRGEVPAPDRGERITLAHQFASVMVQQARGIIRLLTSLPPSDPVQFPANIERPENDQDRACLDREHRNEPRHPAKYPDHQKRGEILCNVPLADPGLEFSGALTQLAYG